MRAASTPTRRTIKQQTLHAMVVSPTTVSSAPSAAADSDAKRLTRGSATADVAAPSSSPKPSATTRTPSPSRARARTPRSSSLVIVRTPQLRPRRTPTSVVGLRDPYDKYSLDALRDECARRGLSTQTREQDGAKGAIRGKARYVELLQEADMLAMFERQSQKKSGRRAARTVKLTPPPAPIRVASATTYSPRRASVVRDTGTSREAVVPVTPGAVKATGSSTPAAPIEAAASLSVTAAPTTTATLASAVSLSTPAPTATATSAATTKAGVAKATAKGRGKGKKTTRTPPKTKLAHPVAATSASESVTAVLSHPADGTTKPAVPEIFPAPWLAPAPEARPTTDQTIGKVKVDEISSAVTKEQRTVLPDTVDLTEDGPTSTVDTQETTTIRLAASDQHAHPPPSASLVNSQAVGASRPPTQAIRARRGCRFRLINVLLSPDFNTRWSGMNVPVKSRSEVNPFWRDAHISFLCQNSFYDKVHFDDPLFENVKPDVIQNHTAQKLQQMWTEIVSTYRRAHNASVKSNRVGTFLDHCAGRLDLLYLHMALTLEPELHKLVLSRSKVIPAVAHRANDATVTPVVAVPKAAKPTPREQPRDGFASGEEPLLAASSSLHQEHGPRFVELQNPEMLPDWLLEDQAKTAAERGLGFEHLPSQVQQPVVTDVPSKPKSKLKKTDSMSSHTPDIHPPIAHALPVHTRDMVLHSSAINSIDDSASSDYETQEPGLPVGGARRRAPGKRRRKASSTDLVEVPSTRELVPHPHKRMHTAVTTTMTRSQEMVLPPDEFEIQTNRLRKINESIEQCYRTLANRDAILNDMHREDVESDLRFYLGIKKRIQEQIVMFMHGF